MNDRQAKLLTESNELATRLAAKKQQSGAKAGASPALWKYTDPEGNDFYLETKKTTVKSPFSGKSFSARPVKHTPSQVGQEMKEEANEEKAAKTASADAGRDPWEV